MVPRLWIESKRVEAGAAAVWVDVSASTVCVAKCFCVF